MAGRAARKLVTVRVWRTWPRAGRGQRRGRSGPDGLRPGLVVLGGGAVWHLVEGDCHVGDEDQVVVTEDDLDLGAGPVQAQRPPGFDRDGDRAAAGLDGNESEASTHRKQDNKLPGSREYDHAGAWFDYVEAGLTRA